MRLADPLPPRDLPVLSDVTTADLCLESVAVRLLVSVEVSLAELVCLCQL